MNKKNELIEIRFAVVTAFLNQCQKENDYYVYWHSKTKMEIDYKAVESAIIVNIEKWHIGKYGQINGENNIIKLYKDMLDDISKCGADTSKYKLSEMGLEKMNYLFSSLIDMFETDIAHRARATLQ